MEVVMPRYKGRLGILVGGGPAPGINSAISSAAIEARNSGVQVVGIYDGFEHLVKGRTDVVRPLEIEDVSRIHFQGGSILRTSRTNPSREERHLENTVKALRELDITILVTIGGDDTAFGAREVSRAAKGAIRVAHVPKTIDNDLPLPAGMPTFGFETARHLGTQLVLNLMEDSRTTKRWYFVVVMGRKAGHLALGIGKSAGATLTVIPEEFPKEHVSLQEVARVLEGSILKRRVMGRRHGVAVIAEGFGEKFDPDELAQVPGVEVHYDQYGHIGLGEIPLAAVLKKQVQRNFAERGETIAIVESTLGYELRSAFPIPFDIDYTRDLGYGATRFLLSETTDERLRFGGLVCLEAGRLRVVPFEDLEDPTTGRTRVRLVDLESVKYKVASKYMIRLTKEDLEDREMRSKLAGAAGISEAQMLESFSQAVASL